MTARVLVVDDILANVRLLEARLTADYFEVLTAQSGPEALEVATAERPDIILLDVMMPGMDGFEVCRKLKLIPETQHIPVIMVTALDHPSDKIQGLEAGADDFLTKPVDDIALVTRVKNLARLKTLNDEMVMRATTGEQMGLSSREQIELARAEVHGRVLLVDDHERSAGRLADALTEEHEAVIETNPQDALFRIPDGNFDVLMVSLNLDFADGLRLCSQVRSLERMRRLPIIILVEPGDNARLMRGLEMGVNDYLLRPVDKVEMLARVRTQVRRKRYSDFLRNRLEESVELALIDPLTGLYNRRYMESHMRTLVDEALESGQPFSILIADIDFFKLVNDNHGHDVGDVVLKDFATRMKDSTRGIDLTCRYGGEEFVLVMPDTDLGSAFQVGERIRQRIAADPFSTGEGGPAIKITASVGVAALEHPDDTPEVILKRADQALYCAKRDGRNRVVADAA